MQKEQTIAATMKKFMESGPSVKEYDCYKALNDAVGAVHGLPAGKCQALAGPKAWAWTPDTVTGKWRKSTPEEVEEKREAAAGKSHGTRTPKVLSDSDRAALEAQIKALHAVANPALAPLLADLVAKRNADDAARKGTLRDRLTAAVTKLGMAKAVEILEAASRDKTEAEVEKAIEYTAEPGDGIVDRVLAKAFAR